MQWTLLVQEQDGHKLFRDEDGRVAVADQSGYYPHQTDDGVLYLTPPTEVIVDLRTQPAGVSFLISNQDTAVMLSPSLAIWYAAYRAVPVTIRTQFDDYRLLD
jgi:hypothetical protein